MNNRGLAACLVAGSFAIAGSMISIAQSAPAPAGGAKPPPFEILDFKPTLSDLMTMLIQPRHIKLWAAAQQRNWTLAAFELNELRSGFDKVAATIPKYLNVDLGPTFISLMGSKIQAVNGAITAQNTMNFNTAYADLTTACNSCHEALNHPYLVMKVPDATGYPNQDFRPVPGAAPLKK